MLRFYTHTLVDTKVATLFAFYEGKKIDVLVNVAIVQFVQLVYINTSGDLTKVEPSL